MTPLVGVIPAAGRGSRLHPYTKGIPKCMLEVDGEPNLARLVKIMRDDLGITHIVVVVGRFGAAIRRYCGDGSRFGVKLTFVQNDQVDSGLSHSILLSKPYVEDYFCVMLADECYIDGNHRELAASDYTSYLATCAVKHTRDPEQIRRNYSVVVDDGLIRTIREKPDDPGPSLLGLGTFLFHRRIYEHLEAALHRRNEAPADPVSVLGRLCGQHQVAPFFWRGDYVNINTSDDLNLANNLVRSRGFESRPMSLALIMRGTREETLRSLAEFTATGRFRQTVVVVRPGTDLSGDDLGGAEVTTAPTDDYGDMLRAGLDACHGDLLFAAYGDGSFSPRDVPKFLEYLKEADLVVGTRTTRQLVHQGTNMRGVVRLGHLALAKILDLVWWGYGPSLTDVGCTYRALWSSTYRLIRPRLCQRGPEYSVEVLLETLKCRKRVIEIPVNFKLSRKGVKERDQTLRTALKILALIVARRVRSAASEAREPVVRWSRVNVR